MTSIIRIVAYFFAISLLLLSLDGSSCLALDIQKRNNSTIIIGAAIVNAIDKNGPDGRASRSRKKPPKIKLKKHIIIVIVIVPMGFCWAVARIVMYIRVGSFFLEVQRHRVLTEHSEKIERKESRGARGVRLPSG